MVTRLRPRTAALPPAPRPEGRSTSRNSRTSAAATSPAGTGGAGAPRGAFHSGGETRDGGPRKGKRLQGRARAGTGLVSHGPWGRRHYRPDPTPRGDSPGPDLLRGRGLDLTTVQGPRVTGNRPRRPHKRRFANRPPYSRHHSRPRITPVAGEEGCWDK